MSCYSPLKAFQIGLTEAGKPKFKIVSRYTHHVELVRGSWISASVPIVSSYAEKSVFQSIEIPCGKCIGCRLDYSREWANRCMLEKMYHGSAYFLTITYSDEFLPRSFYGDELGNAIPIATLRKRDLQLFFKRLRKAGNEIRYFACGEYGDETLRPHYHAIVFGLELDDLQLYKKSDLNYQYYNSESLQRCWSLFDNRKKEYVSPLGHVIVGDVSWDTCAYVARYVVKKQKGLTADVYEEFNIEPEFAIMSRKPGIGRSYYDDNKTMFDFDYLNLNTQNGGIKFRHPKYYRRLLEIDDEGLSNEYKKRSALKAELLKDTKKRLTDVDYYSMLEVEERNKANKIKLIAKRGVI